MRDEGGFTLIELMVVTVVLGTLVGLVLLGVGTFATTSKEAVCRAEIDSLKTANAAYKAKHAGANAPDVGTLRAERFLADTPLKYTSIANGVTTPASADDCDTTVSSG